jgi:hypothetical protein
LIGTGRNIETPDQSTYAKEFSVFVTDPDSTPINNALMTFSAPPVKFNEGGVYWKGGWEWEPISEIYIFDANRTACPNEDVNGNGILDAGEDNNGDGQLTPGNVVSIPASGTTDANGQARVDIRYSKQFGGWAQVNIAVKAESAGSESQESQRFNLPVAFEDRKIEGSPPPSSPFGSGTNCNDTL